MDDVNFEIKSVELNNNNKKIKFFLDEDMYTATVTDKNVELWGKRHYKNLMIARFDRETNESYWTVDHSCGAAGYNPELGDSCHACTVDHPEDALLRATKGNYGTIMVSGSYSTILDNFLKSGQFFEKVDGLEAKLN